MAQLFTLQLTDGVTTIDFLSSSYKVSDGGFDVNLPSASRQLGLVRPGFYLPVSVKYSYREAKISFSVYGSSRSDILSKLHAIERVLINIHNQTRLSGGKRGELSYSWEGTTDMTYFEVYGGDLDFPSDILTVEKMHAQTTYGVLYIPTITLNLQLSAMGYGISIHTGTPTAIPLFNPNVEAKTTDAIEISNPRESSTPALYNYVEIDGDDIPGVHPAITKLVFTTDDPYSSWVNIYIGLQQYPYPSELIFDSASADQVVGGTEVSNSDCEGGSYRSMVFSSARSDGIFSAYSWELTNDTVGLFYAFYHAFNAIPSGVSCAIGVDDYVSFGINYKENYVTSKGSIRTMPLGSIQLPTVGTNLADYGTINPNLMIGLWIASTAGFTFTMDNLTLLPIGSGLRILRARLASSAAGDYVDDPWKGVAYFDNGVYISSPFYPLMDSLKLEPGIDQRLYFMSIGTGTLAAEKTRTFKVKAYAVPTYLTLAL